MIAYLLLLVATAALGMFLWGLRLPQWRHASRDVLINAPKAQVWSVMTDFLRQVEWRSDLQSLQMAADAPPGKEAWTERPRRGRPRAVRVTRHKPGRRLDLERCCNGRCTGTWSASLDSAAQATRVTVAEARYLANPLLRALAQWRDRESALEVYLRDLKQRSEASRAGER